MAFKGLFIGIDRYASPGIGWLGCSTRDAQALSALFSDNLGDGSVLLLDERATRVAIESEFKKLETADRDDVVVVAFSGHGSDTHELVTFDADPKRLHETALPLDHLSELFARIPARRLICFLDCCFSGGAGAKVFHAEVRPRDLPSTDALLSQLSGEGRLIFTASAATEPAWESPKVGHGLMTQHLLEALQGVPEVLSEGKIGLYRLLEYVTRRVIDMAKQFGKVQQPAIRGRIDGDVSWPVMHPGTQFLALFPDLAPLQAAASIDSLRAFGFPQVVLDAWSSAIPALNELQIAAINEYGLLRGEHLVVSAPTSSGKTMIGELAALRGALERRRALFLLPLKALVADKQRQFSALYGPLGIRTIEATGDSDDITDLLRGQYDIALLTYEKFAAIALTTPHVLEHAGVVVIDEVQMIADHSRGANLEFLLTLLKMRRERGVDPQVIALSAVIGDTNGLERWLGARLLRHDKRPVPLDEGILQADGRFRYIDGVTGLEQITAPLIQRQFGKGSSQDWVIPLVQRLVSEQKQVIVFRETKGETVGCANYLASHLALPAAQDVIDALPVSDGTHGSETLRRTLRSGVAFHNANLDREERRVIEESFRASGTRLRVIVATTTLAMGVNTPAGAVVVVGLEHPAGGGRATPYSVAEYKNLVGRAGRLGVTSKGESFLLALNPMDEHRLWGEYVLGHPEDLVSRFLDSDTDLRSLILRVLATVPISDESGMSAEEIALFLESSFGAFQEVQRAQHWRWNHAEVLAAVEDLRSHHLIKANREGRLSLEELGRLAGEGGVAVESVVRIVECLSGLQQEAITDPLLIAVAQCTVELDDVLIPLNRKSTQKEPDFWALQLRQQGVAHQVMSSLRRWPQDKHTSTLRAKRAASCLLYVSAMPLGDVERTLTQFGAGFDGAAGPIRSVASRTCDVLGTVVRAAEVLTPGLDLGERKERLMVRLEVGITSEVVDVARYAPLRLGRTEYQRLMAAGLHTVDAIDTAKDDALLSVLANDKEKVAILRAAVRREKTRREQLVTPVDVPKYVS